MRSTPMLEDEDSLPCPQLQSPFYDRNDLARSRQNHFDVRCRVIGAFGSVGKVFALFRHQPFEKRFEIDTRGAVGIFKDDQTRARVLNENRSGAGADAAFRNDAIDFVGDFISAFSLRPDFKESECVFIFRT